MAFCLLVWVDVPRRRSWRFVSFCVAVKTQQQLGEEIGTTGQYINRVLKKNGGIVNDTFVKMMDALGYNIVLTYEKKG